MREVTLHLASSANSNSNHAHRRAVCRPQNSAKIEASFLLALQIVRHNGIEEMASLLLLVAEEEVDSGRSGARSVETGASEGSGHSSDAAGSSPSTTCCLGC